MPSLRRKVSYGYYAVVALLLGLSAFVVVELRLLERRIVAGEALAEFFDATLEIRRFEKNYFLYAQWEDLNESMRYAGRARELLDRNGRGVRRLRFRPPAGHAARPAAPLRIADATVRGGGPRPERKDLEQEVRRAGKEIVTLAEQISGSERRSLQVLLARYRRGLVGAIVLLSALAIAIGQVLAREVVRPLRVAGAGAEQRRRGALRAGDDRLARPRDRLADQRAQPDAARARAARAPPDPVREARLARDPALGGGARAEQPALEHLDVGADPRRGDGAGGGELAAELVGQIGEQTDRARNIVRSLLEFSRDREFRKEPLPLRPLVEETVRFLKGQIPPGVSVEVAVPAEITLQGDRQRLQQVFLNLVKNAAEAVPPETGRVVVSARRVPAGRRAADGRGARRARRRAAGGRRRRNRGPRQRPGHTAGDQKEDLRPFLHDQGRRQGLGARAVRRLRDHRRARRRHSRGGCTRRRDPLHDPAACVREA